jgi:type I restriction enzyme S subunit
MNWPAYTDYNESGVDWLGELPAHWGTKPLWSMFTRLKNTGFQDEAMLSVYREHGVVVKDSRSDNLNKTAEDRNIYQLVGPGWLVTNRMKAWQGSVGISSHRGIVSGHYICFRPEHGEVDSYLNYLLRSSRYVGGYQTLSRGVRPGQAEIDNDLYRSMPVVVPPIEEQVAIAEFLDAEIVKIDRLIGKQEQLIATLREDRTATITHAVTKGLDPHVKLVDSGVAWLGDMPSHWVPARLKNVILSIDSGTSVNGSDSPAGPDEIGVLKTSCVSAGWFNAEANKTVLEEDLSRVTCPVQEERLIVNRANTPLLALIRGWAGCLIGV